MQKEIKYFPCDKCGKKPVNRHGVISYHRMVFDNRVMEVCESCAFAKK